MVRLTIALLCTAVSLSLVGSTAVSAHASLQTCTIKNQQVFRAGHLPRQVSAVFAEPLDPAKSWMAVFENQSDHGLVTETQVSHVNFRNPKQITLRLPKIQRGKYYLIWYTHSTADNHFAAGIVYFGVK